MLDEFADNIQCDQAENHQKKLVNPKKNFLFRFFERKHNFIIRDLKKNCQFALYLMQTGFGLFQGRKSNADW